MPDGIGFQLGNSYGSVCRGDSHGLLDMEPCVCRYDREWWGGVVM